MAIAAAVPVVLATALALLRPNSLIGLERATYDSLVRWAGANYIDGRIVIVDIDERSLARIGQWPWSREVVGRLVSRLRDRGASTIALDIMFSEPDRHGHTEPADATFADALRSSGALLGYAFTFDGDAPHASGCELHPLDLTLAVPAGGNLESPFFRASDVICSLPELARAAGTSGFLNAAPDSDGILRRVPLLLEFDGRVYPSLALAAAMADRKRRDAVLRIANVNTLALVVDDRTIPLDGKSHLLVRYRGGKGMFPYVSAADVLEGPPLPAALFEDKLVFVGTTALGTREVVATPFDTLFAGVEVQATVADNLLRNDFFYRPEHAATLEGLATLVLGLVAAFAIGTRGVRWGVLWALASLVAVWVGASHLLTASGWFLSPLFPAMGVGAAAVAGTAAKYSYERVNAVRFRQEMTISQQLMVESLLSLFEARDFETGLHARRTRQYAELLALELRHHPRFRDYLTPERIDLLARLAPLHDIGKVAVPDHVLNKPGALTGAELEEVRQHPVRGRDVLLQAERRAGADNDAILSMAKDIVYTHHERWDGTGYPRGLCGEQIPIPGRLVALVDVYDALVSNRVYRPALPHERAIDVIVEGREKHFDPAIVDAFLHVAQTFRPTSAGNESQV